MVKLYKRTIALLERVAALPLESQYAEEREIIAEARDILAKVKELS